MTRLGRALGSAASAGALVWASRCAVARPRGTAAGAPPAPTAAAAPLPADRAPSGTLYRVGLKSDVATFALGSPGSPWILVAGGRAGRLRGPLLFSPRGAAAARRYVVQAGAYSQDGTARDMAGRLAGELGVRQSVAFSADRGVYRVLLGDFGTREEAAGLAEKLKASGRDALVVEAAAAGGPAEVAVSDEAGTERGYPSPVDLYPDVAALRATVDGAAYRGTLRVLVNPRGSLNVVDRVDVEEYLYGVVPAEMGPKRFDEPEALKAQAVAARTYAFAHRGQFEAEGYDLCATPKCQVYSGLAVEDPLSTAAVDATRGLVLASNGRFADALFVSTCGGRTENVENVFGEPAEPYLVSVECGELQTTRVEGAAVPRGERSRARSGLEWRGYALGRRSPKSKTPRAAAFATAQEWAGVERKGAPPAALDASKVYASLVPSFGLEEARAEHLSETTVAYDSEAPSATTALTPESRDAYDLLVRLRFGAGEALPPADRKLDEEEYAGLLFSAALRLSGVAEGSGRFLSRDGSNLWIKTADGRAGLPLDPDMPLARRVGDAYFPSPTLTLRPGDRVRWWKRGSQFVALWVELDSAGPTFERESAWTEWVRRVPAIELARRMSGRVGGSEVREITVLRRSPAGRAIEARVRTESGEAVLRGFDLRQALGLPELLFTVQKVKGASGEPEFVFLGRGWGHGVGLCQNGAFGMALAGRTYDAILGHYYSGVSIVPAASVASSAPSTR